MSDVPRAYRPALIPWLVEAADGIAVLPEDPNDALSSWVVEVNNGLGGHDGAGSVVAHCRTELEAELVAAALWALFERSGGERPELYDDGGLPVHFPIGVTADGQGPTEPDEPHHRECWCIEPRCAWTIALAAERAAGAATASPELKAAYYAGWKKGQQYDSGYVNEDAFELWMKTQMSDVDCPQTKFPDGTRCGEYGWHASDCPARTQPG